MKRLESAVELRWALPFAPDLAFVELTRSVVPPREQQSSASRVLYRGRGTRFLDRTVRRGVFYEYVLAAVDRVGNRSRAVVRRATVPLALFAPRNGSRIAAPTVLRWLAVPVARYYNVQVYRAGRKVLSAWPGDPRYRLRAQWRFDGRRYRLTPGHYRWYVWPGIGARADARYGALLGSSSFVVRGRT